MMVDDGTVACLPLCGRALLASPPLPGLSFTLLCESASVCHPTAPLILSASVRQLKRTNSRHCRLRRSNGMEACETPRTLHPNSCGRSLTPLYSFFLAECERFLTEGNQNICVDVRPTLYQKNMFVSFGYRDEHVLFPYPGWLPWQLVQAQPKAAETFKATTVYITFHPQTRTAPPAALFSPRQLPKMIWPTLKHFLADRMRICVDLHA